MLGLCLVALLFPGCLAPGPIIEPIPRAAPNLQSSLAEPLTTQILVVEYGEQVEFKVPVTFATEGEYFYNFWRNWDLAPEVLPNGYNTDPSQTEIVYAVRINQLFDRGCQQVTLVLTYTDNLEAKEQGGPRTPKDPTLVASTTWWLNVDPQGPPETLENCPLKGAAAPTD